MAPCTGFRKGDVGSRVGMDTVMECKSWVNGCEDDSVKARVCVCVRVCTHMDWCVTQGEGL